MYVIKPIYQEQPLKVPQKTPQPSPQTETLKLTHPMLAVSPSQHFHNREKTSGGIISSRILGSSLTNHDQCSVNAKYSPDKTVRSPACGVPNRSTRIVGGVVTEMNEYPWLVGLSQSKVNSNQPFCGGSVYNDLWVVTAAHCVDGSSPSSIEVLYNMWDWTSTATLIKRTVAQIIMHPQYNSANINNDIALIRVSSPVNLDLPGIMPVCLPSSTDNFENKNGIVTGWGTLTHGGSQPDKNYEVTVPIKTDSVCTDSYGSEFIANTMICAGFPSGGSDSCQGDSGGPLTVDVNGQHHLIISTSFRIMLILGTSAKRSCQNPESSTDDDLCQREAHPNMLMTLNTEINIDESLGSKYLDSSLGFLPF
ncbi:trypsin-1-like [Penaeus monodon]|uniref:trypsin-1-like n=1 Tax=Penaeus monodon TaxID=6687 RepID=UPI0018A6EA49|nr:trypsin-1-like [Penaeus monodon]